MTIDINPRLNTALMRAKTLRFIASRHMVLDAVVVREILSPKFNASDLAVTAQEHHSSQDILFLVDALHAPDLNAGYTALLQYAKLDAQRNSDIRPRQLLAWEAPRDGSVSEDRILLHIQPRFYAGAETRFYFPVVNSIRRIDRLESDMIVGGSWVVGERAYTNTEGKSGTELAVILTPHTPLLISTFHPETHWIEDTLVSYKDSRIWVWSDRDSDDPAYLDKLVLQLHADANDQLYLAQGQEAALANAQ